jgi:pilus assembly protein FimV
VKIGFGEKAPRPYIRQRISPIISQSELEQPQIQETEDATSIAQTQIETQTSPEPQVQIEPQAQVETQTISEPQVEIEIQTIPDPQVEIVNSQTEIEIPADINVDIEVNIDLETIGKTIDDIQNYRG